MLSLIKFITLLSIMMPMICFGTACREKNNSNIEDYGVHGHLFIIAEKSLLDEITDKLSDAKASGKLAELNEEFKLKVVDKISNPTPVKEIKKAECTRSWTYDATYTQETDILDSSGKIIVKAGTKVNPLEQISWGEDLIFIDGTDEKQINWALEKQGKIVLVNGSPIKLSEKYDRAIYFDQAGILTKHFNIKFVPAKITQDGKLLRVTEVNIDDKQVNNIDAANSKVIKTDENIGADNDDQE